MAPSVLGLDPAALAARLGPAAAVVLNRVHRRLDLAPAGFDELAKPARARVAGALDFGLPAVVERRRDPEGRTEKLLLELAPDRVRVECVLMLQDHRRPTFCVSTQAGCGMGCTFCATGRMGLARDLAPAEVVAQVFVLRRELAARGLPHDSFTLVLMGMGEPFAATDATLEALRLLVDPALAAVGPRRITVSTIGFPAGIRRLAALGLPVTLAVSLHAPDPGLRGELMPAVRRIPTAELLAALREYRAATGRIPVLEYLLLAGVNDDPARALALAAMAKDLDALVNLIPWNPVPGMDFRRPGQAEVEAFRDRVAKTGARVTVRWSRGVGVDAGCGQLATASVAV